MGSVARRTEEIWEREGSVKTGETRCDNNIGDTPSKIVRMRVEAKEDPCVSVVCNVREEIRSGSSVRI